MAETAIEWATHVWNPVTGCSRVSPGCAHCYALTYAGRLKAMGQPKYQRDGGRGSGPGFAVTLHEHELAAPATWRAPRRVFVNSMSDLFHEDVPEAFIERVFSVMALAPRHEFLVLTKRADRMADVVPRVNASLRRCHREPALDPLPNVWLGVSIENRRFVHRADLLRETPAAVRFISAEPLLGPLVFDGESIDYDEWGRERFREPAWGDGADVCNLPPLDPTGIDWTIIGGESGPDHRPMRLEWARALVAACREAGSAVFVKQLGGARPGTKLEDLPEDLRIRDFPAVHVAA
jgi:protein gp37